jgi:RNA polymerase sigma factor (sigma-70 family)
MLEAPVGAQEGVGVRSDAELVGAAAAGEPAAFDELYRRHSAAARRVAGKVTRNEHDAADAVSEAFARVFTVLSRDPASEISFRPYLLTTTRHAAVDLIRGDRRSVPSSDDDDYAGAAASPAPAEAVVDGGDRAMMAEAFESLPQRWQAVLWLTEVERCGPRQAADVLGITANNVSQLAFRARTRLRARYVQAHVRKGVRLECEFAVERLGAHVTGTLARRDAVKVQDHLSACNECHVRASEIETLEPALRSAALPIPLALAPLLTRLPQPDTASATGRRRLFRRGAPSRRGAGRSGGPAQPLSGDVAAASPGVSAWASTVPHLTSALSSGPAVIPRLWASGLGGALQALLDAPLLARLAASAGVALAAASIVTLGSAIAPGAPDGPSAPVKASDAVVSAPPAPPPGGQQGAGTIGTIGHPVETPSDAVNPAPPAAEVPPLDGSVVVPPAGVPATGETPPLVPPAAPPSDPGGPAAPDGSPPPVPAAVTLTPPPADAPQLPTPEGVDGPAATDLPSPPPVPAAEAPEAPAPPSLEPDALGPPSSGGPQPPTVDPPAVSTPAPPPPPGTPTPPEVPSFRIDRPVSGTQAPDVVPVTPLPVPEPPPAGDVVDGASGPAPEPAPPGGTLPPPRTPPTPDTGPATAPAPGGPSLPAAG